MRMRMNVETQVEGWLCEKRHEHMSRACLSNELFLLLEFLAIDSLKIRGAVSFERFPQSKWAAVVNCYSCCTCQYHIRNIPTQLVVRTRRVHIYSALTVHSAWQNHNYELLWLYHRLKQKFKTLYSNWFVLDILRIYLFVLVFGRMSLGLEQFLAVERDRNQQVTS